MDTHIPCSRSAGIVSGIAFAIALAACSGAAQTASDTSGTALYDPKVLPTGPLGDEIRLGHDAIADTQKLMPHNIRAGMNCAACHIGAGTKARGGSFVGTYARFPQWNKRAKRVITLQDRLAECFLYSENGTPPSYTSKEMIGMVAYIAYLSRRVPTGETQAESDSFLVKVPSTPPNVQHGATLYAQKCATCHQPDGAGVAGTYPPLWGPKSFNNGAGMAHLNRITGFVMYNMPANSPNTLSFNDAYDIAGYVLSQKRPKFKPSRAIAFPAQPAVFF
jgi:thiosulfate dehydrogenase